MRKPLALAVAALGAALALPVSPAAAVCSPEMYELTGYCSPCNLAGAVYREATTASGVTVDDRGLLTCAA